VKLVRKALLSASSYQYYDITPWCYVVLDCVWKSLLFPTI